MAASDHALFARPTLPKRMELLLFTALRLGTYFVLACALYVFADIGLKGGQVVFQSSFPFVNVPFLTEKPETLIVFEHQGVKYQLGDRAFRAWREERGPDGQLLRDLRGVRIETYVYASGGIFPNIAGTIILTMGAVLIALVLGIFSAIFLSEYARQGPFIRFVRLAILNLAGVPSIVYGLFGYGMFVILLGWNVSILAGWFTLAFMVLPIVITASEESLRAVPQGYREGSLALGASQWQTIRLNVLPYALPGMLTSSILAIARVAGETAPIMFTAAFVMRDELPWEVQRFFDFFFQGVMALPYHIYVVSAKIPQNEYTEQVQYGTAFVFLFTVAAIAMASILLRIHLRKKYRW